MANPALRRRQLARTCKKYGLLIQPNALPILIEEMESRDHGNIDGGTSTFGDFLTVLQTKLSRSTSASAANLVTLDLVERVLLEEQQEQQQQQAQVLAAKAKQDAKLKKRKQQQQKILIQNEQDDEDEEIEETSSNNNNYNSLVAVSSKSKLKSKVLSSSSLVPSVSSSSNSRSNITTTNNKKSKLWKVISAFETPKLVYDSMRKQFRYEQGSASSSLMGSSQDIMTMRIQRYELVKQKVDRSRQEQRLSYLTTIDRLLGTKNNHTQHFNNNNTTGKDKNNKLSLLGMLKSNPSLRCLELEDPTGCVPLRIDLLLDNNNDNNDYDNDNNDIIGCDVDTTGIYLEGSMVLVKGNHEESTLLTTNSEDNDGTVFRCTSIELAPIEVKSITKLHLPPSPYSYDDDFNNSGGGRSSQSNSSSPLPIYSLSNLSLDDPDCIDRLEFVIDRMIQGNKKKRSSSSMEIDDEDQDEENVPDSILVLFGDFCTESTTSSQALDELASVLQHKNIPSKHSILLIPGPNDVGSNACWPLPAWNKKNIPSSMHPFLAASNSNTSNISTKRMRDNNNNNASSLKGGNVYLCSNPCRLECADGRQVVLLRKDLIRESLQHQVLADADSIAYSNAKAAASARGSARGSSQSQSHPSSPSLTSRIIHHALSQGHLSPSSSSQQAASTSCAPIYWNYDHSMTLYPLPDLMIVGLDPEYLDTGFDNNTESEVGGRTVGCRVVSPASKPSQNEWECSLTTLRSNKKGNKLKLDVEFLKNNDDDDDDSDSDDDDVEEGEKEKQDQENQNDEEIYENYHMLGGTQTQQSQVSAY